MSRALKRDGSELHALFPAQLDGIAPTLDDLDRYARTAWAEMPAGVSRAGG